MVWVCTVCPDLSKLPKLRVITVGLDLHVFTIKFNGFEREDKKNLTNRPIPGKPGQVRGNRNIVKVGPMYDSTCMYK